MDARNILDLLTFYLSRQYLDVGTEDLNYDTTQIKSRDWKIGDYTDKKWDHLMRIIEPGMKLKGYV